AALLMLDPSTGSMAASYGWKRGAGPARPECVPEAAVAQCLEEKAGAVAEVQGVASRLWLCPLPCNDGIAGLLALATTGSEELKPRHREWLCAAGRIAGGLLLCQHEIQRLRRANQELTAEMDARRLIVGDSPAIATIKEQIVKAAPSDATVLITGETGAGKEPVARAIHARSARAHGPFVAVNCAALSPTLLESDLFGHERGAFTGAVTLKRGRLEAAAGGTLFLDEIGELDAGIQARLLRVLQEREFERVGGLARLRADIRLIAATNRSLAEEVERGTFRKDLYYRIKVVVIHVPPLRERRADIPLLAAHFLSLSSAPAARRLRGLSPKARRRMMAYDWPGNVRELQNAIEHAVVFSRGEWIEEEDLPESLLETATPEAASEPGYYSSLREAKRRILLAALAESGGSQQEAARRLGLNPSHLSRLIRSLGLRPEAGSMR
ncbi:MAG: sigma-54 interaction domain-containing protein, partial [Bryobacteraceae bacterium]